MTSPRVGIVIGRCLNKENININDLVEEVASNFRPQVVKKGLTISCLVPKDSVDVFVDKEGLMYLTDTNAGLYILQYEGK